MAVTEVTQAQWRAVMGTDPSHFAGDDLPDEQVSWNGAQAFLTQLSQVEGIAYSLPIEGQWEYACRAGTQSAYSFGEDPSRLWYYAWYGANSGLTTHSVGTEAPNAWGLHDMHGNVHEWCQDWYDLYPPGPVVDPVGPQSCVMRVLRGGPWNNSTRFCRSAYRLWLHPSYRYNAIGFRIVRQYPTS